MKRKLEFAVPEEMGGAKLIHFLRSHVKMSYRLAMSLKQYPDGMMRNGEKIRTVDKVKAGEIIEINIPQEESSIEPINIPIDVIYEDEDILLINKQCSKSLPRNINGSNYCLTSLYRVRRKSERLKIYILFCRKDAEKPLIKHFIDMGTYGFRNQFIDLPDIRAFAHAEYLPLSADNQHI